MAALSSSSSECCTLKKTLNRLISNTSSSPRARTRSEPLYVISLERYCRDADFALRFPDSISISESLFDATFTDGDCKIRVSLDPAVNRLISVNALHCGSVIRHVELSRGEDSASFMCAVWRWTDSPAAMPLWGRSLPSMWGPFRGWEQSRAQVLSEPAEAPICRCGIITTSVERCGGTRLPLNPTRRTLRRR